jgi:hypothetical protein
MALLMADFLQKNEQLCSSKNLPASIFTGQTKEQLSQT